MSVKRNRENSPDQSDASPESQPMRAGISVRKSRFLTSTSLLEQEAPPTFFPRIQTHTHVLVCLCLFLHFELFLSPTPFHFGKSRPISTPTPSLCHLLKSALWRSSSSSPSTSTSSCMVIVLALAHLFGSRPPVILWPRPFPLRAWCRCKRRR